MSRLYLAYLFGCLLLGAANLAPIGELFAIASIVTIALGAFALELGWRVRA